MLILSVAVSAAEPKIRATVMDPPNKAPDKVIDPLQVGHTLVAQGRKAEAMTKYQQAITLNADRLEAYYWLGQLASQSTSAEKLDLAEHCFRTLASSNIEGPLLSTAWAQLARVFSYGARYEEAVHASSTALELQPESGEMYHNLAVSEVHSGRTVRHKMVAPDEARQRKILMLGNQIAVEKAPPPTHASQDSSRCRSRTLRTQWEAPPPQPPSSPTRGAPPPPPGVVSVRELALGSALGPYGAESENEPARGPLRDEQLGHLRDDATPRLPLRWRERRAQLVTLRDVFMEGRHGRVYSDCDVWTGSHLWVSDADAPEPPAVPGPLDPWTPGPRLPTPDSRLLTPDS